MTIFLLHPVSTEGVVMRRLNAETVERAEPDAAPVLSGPDGGRREGWVRWPVGASSRAGRRPKPRGSRSSRYGDHQWRITGTLLQGPPEQASNIARGTPEGPADLRFHASGMPRRREMPR